MMNIVNKLRYRKICTKWVLKMLTEQQMDAIREISDNLNAYQAGGDNFFRGIATGDESWFLL